MTSPRRSKKCADQGTASPLDWDSPSDETGTVKRRRASCPDNHSLGQGQDTIFEIPTPSDSGSCTSRSFDDTEKSDSLADVEERIDSLINENRSSKGNSVTSDFEITVDDILNNSGDEILSITVNTSNCDQNDIQNDDKVPSPTKKNESTQKVTINDTVHNSNTDKDKVKSKILKPSTPIQKLNKSLDIIKPKFSKGLDKVEIKPSVLAVYQSVNTNVESSINTKKKVASKLRLPFSPSKTMEKPKLNFFQNKGNTSDIKPSLLSSPVRRTISNEYVRLKFGNDTVLRRTVDGKSVPKISPKIQSIIPESPVDAEDPFLNLSPNKKYTVTVNNKVRCDKDNYVIFDPNSGFKPEEILKQSKIPLKSPNGDKSKVPLRAAAEKSGIPLRKSANVSDTDSGILSPNSPVDTSADECSASAKNATKDFRTKKRAVDLDITILDPALAKKATEQIRVSHSIFIFDIYRSEGR